MAGRRDIEAGRAYVTLLLKNQIERGLRGASAQLAAFGRSVKAIGSEMQSIGQGMIGAGAAIAVPIGLSVKTFADFDDAMRTVGAVSQATDVDLAKLTETAKKLGASTSFTAIQVANLMAELGRAGFSPDQIEAMTGAVLNLARATGTDATLASGIMAATIRQFSMDAGEATRVADALTVAANASFNTVEQLGEALSYAGPVAADFGMEVEDVLAILGGLGNVGIQGSEAGTALRRLLTLTGAEAEKLQGIFGVAFLDSAGNARPLIDVLEDINNVTKNMGSGERSQKFNEAFGLLGITSASAIGESIGSIRDLRAQLGGASGAAADAAAKMDAGLGGSFRILLSAVEGVAIGLGSVLAPIIKQIADQVTLIVGNILDWVKQNQSLTIAIVGITAAVIAGGIALVGFGAAISAVGTAVAFAGTVLGAIAAVVGAIASPIGLLAVGLTAIGAGFAYVSGAGSYLTHQLGVLWEAFRAITELLVGGEWAKAWEVAKLAMATLGSAVLDLFGQLPQFIGYAIGSAAKFIADGISSMVGFVKSVIGKLFTALLNSAVAIGPRIIKALVTGGSGGVVKAIGEVISREFEGITAGWNGAPAPTFQVSDRTKRLRSQMAGMIGGGANAAAPATGGPATPATGPRPTGGRTPTFAPEVKDISALRDELNLTESPLQKFAERAKKLHEALAQGVISSAEFAAELRVARNELVDPSPIAKYTDRVRELQQLLRAGLIDPKTFRAEAMEALPDRVKEIIEASKTPLQKLREEMAEIQGYFKAGLITREQLAAEQQRLQGATLPKVSTTAEGTFSAAAAMASMGARVGRPEEKTAENTAVMRRYLLDLLRTTKKQEGLAFS